MEGWWAGDHSGTPHNGHVHGHRAGPSRTLAQRTRLLDSFRNRTWKVGGLGITPALLTTGMCNGHRTAPLHPRADGHCLTQSRNPILGRRVFSPGALAGYFNRYGGLSATEKHSHLMEHSSAGMHHDACSNQSQCVDMKSGSRISLPSTECMIPISSVLEWSPVRRA